MEKLRNKPNIRYIGCVKTIERNLFKRLGFIMSVRLSAWNKSTPTGRILMKCYTRTRAFFENVSRKFKFDSNLTRITGTLHEYLYILMTMFC